MMLTDLDKKPLPGLCPTDKKPCVGPACQAYTVGYEPGFYGVTIKVSGHSYAYCGLAPGSRTSLTEAKIDDLVPTEISILKLHE